ncbi:MAG: hypothetical protein ACTSWQ_03235, partial [Candidatus Thorarchaeota archaeon]
MKKCNKLRLVMIPILAIIVLSFGINPVVASTISVPKTVQFYTAHQGTIAKMGFTTESFLSYGSDLHPQYYASSIASGSDTQGLLFYVETLRIDVEGW